MVPDYWLRFRFGVGGFQQPCRKCRSDPQYRLVRWRKRKPGHRATVHRWRLAHPLEFRAQMMVRRMRLKSRLGIDVDPEFLTADYILALLRGARCCPCCGQAFLLNNTTRRGPKRNSFTLDRIHPDRGYVVGNVVVLCWRCNSVKKDATPDELERITRWLRTVW